MTFFSIFAFFCIVPFLFFSLSFFPSFTLGKEEELDGGTWLFFCILDVDVHLKMGNYKMETEYGLDISLSRFVFNEF
jgi:hypothetical protein